MSRWTTILLQGTLVEIAPIFARRRNDAEAQTGGQVELI